ncbi:MAG TPA: VOC family protein [Bacteroidia bacterium]|nr:VOC family protein [Bacteroidia bacterium]
MIKNSTITLNVKDLDKSISFYESLGMNTKQRWGDNYAELSAPGILIGLHPASEKNLVGNSGNASIGFTTDNFEEVKTLLNSLFIKTTYRDEEGGSFLHFNDPDGSSLYFIKPKY